MGRPFEAVRDREMSAEEAVSAAIDAIDHDDRRTPYGHHQHKREYIKAALRKLLDNTRIT